MIRWLHISDLHLGSKGMSTEMLRDELPLYLRARGLTCDYVFCTGDIRTANMAGNEFTDGMAEYIRSLCDAVGVPVERLFIVPGNHDVNIFSSGRTDAIKRVMFDRSGYYSADVGRIDADDMAAMMAGEEELVSFLSKIYPPDRVALYGDPSAPHFCVETADFNVLHVDSTISYCPGQDRSDFIVGMGALYDVVRRLNPAKPTVLLTHYPFFVLLQDERSRVYWNAGVVRDVPELGISVQDRHRRLNVEYTERGYQYNRPFEASDKPHWLVIGNSFGRDFVNVVLESRIADEVEISFADKIYLEGMDERLAAADLVSVAFRGYGKRLIDEVEVKCWSAGIPPERVIVVGDKSFGENNGHVYARRFRPGYFEQRVEPLDGELFLKRNRQSCEFYGERFLDMIAPVLTKDGQVRVFTPEHCFISADGKHLTKAGARFYAERIDWNKFLL